MKTVKLLKSDVTNKYTREKKLKKTKNNCKDKIDRIVEEIIEVFDFKDLFRKYISIETNIRDIANVIFLNIYICALGRTRTLNPQSRNLIFYPIELLTQKFNF